jgi:hypothetical protein
VSGATRRRPRRRASAANVASSMVPNYRGGTDETCKTP